MSTYSNSQLDWEYGSRAQLQAYQILRNSDTEYQRWNLFSLDASKVSSSKDARWEQESQPESGDAKSFNDNILHEPSNIDTYSWPTNLVYSVLQTFYTSGTTSIEY